ncbi:MAG: hypothetical protein ABIH35_02670 [Patescibacteria group bacterium]
MTANSPKPDEDNVPSFWEKLTGKAGYSEDREGGFKSSLVNAIVRQAEKEVSSGPRQRPESPQEPVEKENEKEKARSALSTAKAVLTLAVIVSLGAWLYFFAMLGESNYFHAKAGKQNLTTEINHKGQLLSQLQTDYADTKKFSKLLRIEGIANTILELDLENPILNYERPQGERVVPRSSSTSSPETLYKTVNENGEIIYLSESEILSLENAQQIRAEFARSALGEILAKAQELAQTAIKTDGEIENNLSNLTTILETIDLAETDFPSAVLKARFSAAQSLAKNILIKVKDLNLKNLVIDIKKQATAIDLSEADSSTRETVLALRSAVQGISVQRPSSFDKALADVATLILARITDNEIYQKVIRIIDSPGSPESGGDLRSAAVIAKNIGKVNTITKLRGGKIAWASVIDRVEKITRLGADLERDTNKTPPDARADIDPDDKLVDFIGYAGKTSKNEIELRGNVTGANAYANKNFTLLSDMIDAFEASKYFQDVEGFTFSKSKDRQGKMITPLNFKLRLQDPSLADERDAEIARSATLSTGGVTGKEVLDLEALQELDFSLSPEVVLNEESVSELHATDYTSTRTNPAEVLVVEEMFAFTDPFDLLRAILNQ